MIDSLLTTYREYLPISDDAPLISMGEGDTPLVASRGISNLVGCDDLYFKLEGCNPSGSFKDRGMVVVVSKALDEGIERIICASTGNTSASAATYGAYANLGVTVVLPNTMKAKGKLAQIIALGAEIVVIDGNFDQALEIVKLIASDSLFLLANSLNPDRIQGQKTVSFELVQSLGEAPNYVFLPVGNGGNITASWLGFSEAYSMGWSTGLPKMIGVQASGAAPLVSGRQVYEPSTIADAIRIGKPANWGGATKATTESGGIFCEVSDEEIVEAHVQLARREGILCDLASAASVAGLIKLSKANHNFDGETVVCMITGSGLKDPDRLINMGMPMKECPATLEDVRRSIS